MESSGSSDNEKKVLENNDCSSIIKLKNETFIS